MFSLYTVIKKSGGCELRRNENVSCIRFTRRKSKKFVEKLISKNTMQIKTGNEEISELFILITPTYGLGMVPREAKKLCKKSGHLLQGVVGSGRHSYGEKNYCRAARKISEQYNVPIICLFEDDGTPEDVYACNERIEQIDGKTRNL